MLRLRRARYLTDLWLLTPDWLFRRIQRWLGITDEGMHEYLCEGWGCRCDS